MNGHRRLESIDDQAAECDTFTRYLCGMPADGYIRRKYEDAQLFLTPTPDDDPVDLALLEAGRRGGFHLSSADIYARCFRPRTTLRRRLIIVLAIIENAPGTHHYLNSAADGGIIVSLIRIVQCLGATAVAMTAGILRFGPRQLASDRIRAVRMEATDAR